VEGPCQQQTDDGALIRGCYGGSVARIQAEATGATHPAACHFTDRSRGLT